MSHRNCKIRPKDIPDLIDAWLNYYPGATPPDEVWYVKTGVLDAMLDWAGDTYGDANAYTMFGSLEEISSNTPKCVWLFTERPLTNESNLFKFTFHDNLWRDNSLHGGA